MKKIILNSVIVLTMIASAGCTRIEDYPDGRFSFDDIFNSTSKTAGYMNSCYDGFVADRGNVYGDHTYLASACDEAHDVDEVKSGPMSQWNNGKVSPFNNPIRKLDAWDSYVFIRRCNIMLAHVDSANIAREFERESYRGEARGLRAFYYLQLLKAYGGVPLVSDNTSEIQKDWSGARMASPSDVARQIISDCRHVIENNRQLGWRSGSSSADNSRMNKGICAAIMSEAALFASSPLYADGSFTWEDAVGVCKEALDGCLENGYRLFTTRPVSEEYSQRCYGAYDYYFLMPPDEKGTDDPESILWGRNQTDGWNYCGLPTIYGGSSAGSCPSQELVDCYETLDGEMPVLGYSDEEHLHPVLNPASQYDEDNPYANRDPRLLATIYYDGAPLSPGSTETVSVKAGGNCELSAYAMRHTRTGYYIRKFISPTSSSRQNNDGKFRVFRLAELYLNYAEAANEASAATAPDAAVDAVNVIRERAGMPALPYGMDKDEFRKRVRNERRVELAYEDKRFYDVRRWDILDVTDRVVTGMRVNDDGSHTRFVVRKGKAYDKKYRNMPIPGKEVTSLMEQTGFDFQSPLWK